MELSKKYGTKNLNKYKRNPSFLEDIKKSRWDVTLSKKFAFNIPFYYFPYYSGV
jgi:hypothetical protein